MANNPPAIVGVLEKDEKRLAQLLSILLSVCEVWGSTTGPVKPNTASPTARHSNATFF